MNIKDKLVQEYLEHYRITVTEKEFRKIKKQLWLNIRHDDDRGLRLTPEGFNFFKNELNLKFYKIELPEELQWTNQLVIWLDKFIDCPWFLDRNSIWVSREKIAVQLILYSGDLQMFGDAKSRALQRN